jgi:hypothetical protein
MPRAAKKLVVTDSMPKFASPEQAAIENAHIAAQIAIDNKVIELALENNEARLRDMFEHSQTRLEFEDELSGYSESDLEDAAEEAIVEERSNIRRDLLRILDADDVVASLANYIHEEL